MLKIAVVGSRNYSSLKDVEDYLNGFKCLIPLRVIQIITGGARGVDKKAEEWALGWGVDCEVIRPINPKDKFSYLLRNVEIISMADMVVAFWDGKSKGTKFVIDYCKTRGIFIKVKEASKDV